MRLLAAVDVNEAPEATVDAVVRWAERLGATVDLAYASSWSTEGLPPPTLRTDEVDTLWRRWAADAEVERTRLAGLLSRIPDRLRGSARLLAGPAAAAIADAGTTYDLVALHTHHRGAASRLVFGSVASQVVRRCPKPVLVIGSDDPAPGDPLVVLAPLEEDAGALPWIKAHLPNAAVAAVHVRSDAPVWVPGPPRSVIVLRDPDAIGETLEEAARAAGFPGLRVHLRGPDRQIGDAIINAAREFTSQLIVMPTHAWRGLARLMLGSVTERVVARAPCAVLVVPWQDPRG